MAAGWNAKLIVHACYAVDASVLTAVSLAVAARHTGGRHVCALLGQGSKSDYVLTLQQAGVLPTPEIVLGEAEEAMAAVAGLDFLVLDCKRQNFARILKSVKPSNKGAVLVCENTWPRSFVSLGYCGLLLTGTRGVRSVNLPHVGSSNGGGIPTNKHTCWMTHVDERSGEDHVYR